ncbi:MAG: autotransporter-associated beta strand repeat-containing protein, partial [Chthoniobacterales bacterium]
LNISSITATTVNVASITGATGSTVSLGSKNMSFGGNNASTTFAGAITGSGNLTKNGTGTTTLSGANTYTGSAIVSAGTLKLENATGSALGSITNVSVSTNAILLVAQSDQVNNSAAVTLSGGTIRRGGNVSEVFGNLNLTTGSFLDYGAANDAGTIRFGTYTPSSLLTVQNFLPGNKLQFGNTISSTNLNNAALFSFSSPWTTSTEGGFFTITAIPEPSTVLAAVGLVGLMLWPSRRRLVKDAKRVLGLRAPMRDRLAALRDS